MKRAIVVSPLAAHDLGDIWDFIARDSIDTADRVIDEIEGKFQVLADMPGLDIHVKTSTNHACDSSGFTVM